MLTCQAKRLDGMVFTRLALAVGASSQSQLFADFFRCKGAFALIAGAGFLEIWRYDTWSQSIFSEVLPRFWQDLLTSEE